MIALHFSGNIAPDQQLELAQLAAGLTNEQMQLLLEKAWADYIPDAAMPDAVSDKILAALFNDDTQPLSKDTFNIIQPVQQVQLEEERNDWLTPVSNQPAVDSTAVEINDKGAKNKKNVLSILLVLTASVAAAALVFIVNNNSGEINNQKKEVWKTFISTYGERKNFQLPDGSVVTLNGGSKVTIGGGYGVSTRDIFLEGEAFFDVKHNKEIPFIVHTSAMDIKAVGTAFDVKAYPGEKNTETALINGVVEVTLKEAQQRKVILQPNQKVQWTSPASGPVDAENEKSKAEDRKQKIAGSVQNITKTDDGDIIETAWKENKLVFTDESLSDIAVLLERWYGVKIVFADDAIRNYRFTGIFEKEELGSVLSILKESRSFNYVTVPGETIKVKLYK
ncbi:MAG: FecR family protein [Ferruginibacter sp.]|nr:FecR family protein [Ferruginibacter sp.]